MENSKDTGTGSDSEALMKVILSKIDTMALREMVMKRLIDCGWKKGVEQMVRNKLNEVGLEKFTNEQIIEMIIPKARASVPDSVREELTQHMREIIQSQLTPLKK